MRSWWLAAAVLAAFDLDVRGGKLYVSNAGPATGSGGVAVLDVAASTPTPRTYDVSFTGMEGLTVQSAGGGDVVSAGEVAVPFTLNTQGGADVVTLRTTAAGNWSDVMVTVPSKPPCNTARGSTTAEP